MDMGNRSTERISRSVFYLVLAVAAVVCGLFYMVEYDRPFESDPTFTAPMFTDVLIGFMLLLTTAAVGFTVWMVVRAMRLAGNEGKTVNNIPARALSWTVAAVTALLLGVTYLTGSDNRIVANGEEYTSVQWLKIADMFVYSGLTLIVLAVGAMIFGLTRYYRKGRTSAKAATSDKQNPS